MLKVEEIVLPSGLKRYILIDMDGNPIQPVMKFLKFLDSKGRKSQTLRTYAYCLRNFFGYLHTIEKAYDEVEFEDVAMFVGWLRNPHGDMKIISMFGAKSNRTEKTINLNITVITSFYDFLYRTDEYKNDLSQTLFKQINTGSKSSYKGFLSHIESNRTRTKHVLKIKEPKKRIQTLTREQIQQLYTACTNARDQFLIRLLFETGFRITEALSLRFEDIEFDPIDGHRIHLRAREIDGLKTGERSIHVSDALMDAYDDYVADVADDLSTDFIFTKVKGNKRGEQMTYSDVNSLMKRLREKTDIIVTPHMFRHTHASIFYHETKNIKATQERLGHSNIQTTMNLYVHTTDEQKRNEWEKAKNQFSMDKE